MKSDDCDEGDNCWCFCRRTALGSRRWPRWMWWQRGWGRMEIRDVHLTTPTVWVFGHVWARCAWLRLINPDCKVETVLRTQEFKGHPTFGSQETSKFSWGKTSLSKRPRATSWTQDRLMYNSYSWTGMAWNQRPLTTDWDLLENAHEVVVDAIDGVANKCRLIYACLHLWLPTALDFCDNVLELHVGTFKKGVSKRSLQ